MGFTRRAAVAVVGVAALLTASACGGSDSDGGTGSKNVEVFTWWADGGEKAGLDGLVGVFGTACAGQTFQNGAVAGGAGANAKSVLASRLQQNDPPDTFQAHAGAELLDYINAGQVEDISADYDGWGLKQAFPAGLIGNLTVDGKIYSVPANIHRANVVWSNKKVLSGAGITADPKDLTEFFAALDKLKAKGVKAPLALGKDWTQLMLFESVLISDLGAEKFTGLWQGKTDWNDASVTKAIADFQRLQTYSNSDRDALDWTDAEKLVMDGKAGYQLMGDWEAADLDAKGFKDYGWFTFPGNGTTFQWLADSFVLPKGAKNPDGTKCWLKTVGSADGQKAFNTKKGSIPARTDANPADYPKYQQSAMADWKSATQVPSCAHGSACSQGWQQAANSALGAFSTNQDAAALQKALAAAAQQYAGK
ncbi:carbohydrate ABC transporter substrate-binding protein (CUT1 family) [Krasilnikovia cinnamomea]|uniref:Carbohydrate ABC transporter substrate-binding protein (CUT1 family) n=1 Tax=Krasilnikovia cinnamomea TaxID=349313 RepID=A0A4Q7ZGM5_9ACTN|nr:extracellular solute-binding protein [Krasilnikovia cinnamomea]RZU49295.1 carbohydrate ABC transporter substrate-binding protein (CUT1 family) [Krasilnikovia cinnamomea]